MNLVTVIGSDEIVADERTVREPERTTNLLGELNTADESGTVALSEGLRVGEGFDGGTELLRRDEVQVLDVVRVLRIGLSTRGRLGDNGEAVPSMTLGVNAGVVWDVQNTVIDASLVETLANLVPRNCNHVSFLLEVQCEYIVIEVVCGEEPIVFAQRKCRNLLK